MVNSGPLRQEPKNNTENDWLIQRGTSSGHPWVILCGEH